MAFSLIPTHVCGSIYDIDWTALAETTLFTIEKRNAQNLDQVDITYTNMSNGQSKVRLTRGASQPVEITVRGVGTLAVRMYVSEHGNETLSIRMISEALAIPAGGEATLTVSTNNVTGIFNQKDFFNRCYVTPSQSFGSIGAGNEAEIDADGDGELDPSVRNSAKIFVAYGYVTTSDKAVEEVGKNNSAIASGMDRNFIVMSDATSDLRYTLTVKAPSDAKIDEFFDGGGDGVIAEV